MYTATVMHRAGLNVTHEEWFNERNRPGGPTVWPPIDGEWSAQAVPYVYRFPQVSVVHQVRHPLKVLGSYLTTGDMGMMHDPKAFGPEGTLIADYGRVWQVTDALERACLLYLRFNQDIENSGPAMRWRVEDLTAEMVAAAGALCGVMLNNDRVAAAIDETRTDMNTRNNAAQLGWDDIPGRWRPQLQDMAFRYGYRN